MGFSLSKSTVKGCTHRYINKYIITSDYLLVNNTIKLNGINEYYV